MDNRVYRPEDPMYIKIHCFEDTITWESPHHDTDLETLFDKFKGLLVAIGFSEEMINKHIIKFAEELQDSCIKEANEDDLP